MSSLIEGAKKKIWSIANQIVNTNPRPQVKFGLVGYRDRGDDYITKKYPLTLDIDSIYTHLLDFKADGGGDGPESVNQALYEAVTKMDWSADTNTLQMIFLVGDAPPHMDYKEDVKYTNTLKIAKDKGLIINTVLCGSDVTTGKIWQEISQGTQGKFVSIDQEGGMIATTTPMDKELSILNDELAKTAILYGKKDERALNQKKLNMNAAAPSESKADQLSFKSKSFAGSVITSRGELIDDIKNKRVKIGEIKEEELPSEISKLSPKDREAYVTLQTQKQEELQNKIKVLVKKRDDYILAEQNKLGLHDGFDMKVKEMIREQAAKKELNMNKTLENLLKSKTPSSIPNKVINDLKQGE